MIKSALQSSLTNDVKYRSMSAGAVPSSEYLIRTYEVGATPLASVTFDNLGQYAGVYKHLQVVYAARSARTDNANDSVAIQLNTITSASYSRHGLLGYLGSVSSQASPSATRMDIGWQATNSQSANIFGAGVIDILDPFETTKNTTLRGLSGTAGTESIIILNSGAFLSTAAVSEIKLFSGFSAANFVTGSRFSLYGVTA